MPPHDRLPNILLITSDQQHWRTLGSNNPAIKTPALDRLASLGVRFDRAYCCNPTCTPTRASIITGMYPSAHGAYTLGTKLPETVPTLGQYLHAAGYHTSLIGKAHFQPLRSTPDCPSVEAYPTLRDLDFWRSFNERQTPWYGFDHVELARNHGDEGHVGQHYALWLEAQGLKDWREYFQPPHDGSEPEFRPRFAPSVRNGPGYGWRERMHWQLPEHLHYTAWTGQRTIAMIEESAARGQPFFCWSSYHDPHPPYCVPEPWASLYDPAAMEDQIGAFVPGEFDHMPPPHRLTRGDDNRPFAPFNEDGRGNHGYHSHQHDRRKLRAACAIYYGMISFMDHWIGRTLDALERCGQLDRTLIIFTTDHGHFLGQHGLVAKGPFHYEDMVRVPFIAALGRRLPPGRVSNQLVSLVDLAPTFLETAGLPTPLQMQGRGRLAQWADPQGPGPTAILVENHHNGSQVHLRTLVTQRWKLTLYRGRDWGELFDLEADPSELHNRFDDPAYAATRAEMTEQMVQADLQREPAPQPRVWGA